MVHALVTGRELSSVEAVSWLIFTTGVFLAGTLTFMPVLAASYYPIQARAAGVTWMLGIGRFGGIVGALAGGPLLRTANKTVSGYASR